MHRNIKTNTGMSLMSVMVSTVLMAIIALTVTRLFVNQDTVIRTVALRDERLRLLEHYRNVIIDGWDNTRSKLSGTTISGAIAIYDRGNTLRIPSAGLTLGANGLYQSDSSGWWTVKTSASSASSKEMLQSPKENTNEEETIVSVKLSVSFDPDKHPTVKTELKEIAEMVFLHNNVTNLTNTQCGVATGAVPPDPTHPSQLDSSGSSFYEGEGAIVQYDFKSNYTKCSQVPLVDLSVQSSNDAQVLRGFQNSNGKVTGKPAYTPAEIQTADPGQTGTYVAVKIEKCPKGDFQATRGIYANGRIICGETTLASRNCLIADPYQPDNPARGFVNQTSSSSIGNVGGNPNNVGCLALSELESYRGDKGPQGTPSAPTPDPTFTPLAKEADCATATTCPTDWICQ